MLSCTLGCALGYDAETTKKAPNYGIKVPLDQSMRARAAPKSVAFIHGTSRQNKTWSLQNWVDLGQRLAASGYQVKLVHGSAESADVMSDTRDEIAALPTVAEVRTYPVLAAY